MKTYFISDLHLDASNPSNIHAFLEFAKQISADSEIQALYILGDLFEYWLGDDCLEHELFQPFQIVVKTLNQLSAQGIQLYFIKGNRDFLIGESFSKQTGCKLLDDEVVIDLYGKQTLIMHGDTLCTDDTEYQQLRIMLRNEHWQSEFLSKSLSERLQVAQHLREQSKEKTAHKLETIMDVNQTKVLSVMQKHQVQTLIHGHTHRVAKHEFADDQQHYRRFVLSDWHGTACYLSATEKSEVFVP